MVHPSYPLENPCYPPKIVYVDYLFDIFIQITTYLSCEERKDNKEKQTLET